MTKMFPNRIGNKYGVKSRVLYVACAHESHFYILMNKYNINQRTTLETENKPPLMAKHFDDDFVNIILEYCYN